MTIWSDDDDVVVVVVDNDDDDDDDGWCMIHDDFVLLHIDNDVNVTTYDDTTVVVCKNDVRTLSQVKEHDSTTAITTHKKLRPTR